MKREIPDVAENNPSSSIDKKGLWQAIERDNKVELDAWLQHNEGVTRNELSGNFFKEQSSLYRIPIFVAINKKKLNAFVFLIEKADVDLLVKDNLCCTVLDAICSLGWLEGLDYLISRPDSIISSIKNKHGERSLFVLHNLAGNMQKEFSENKQAIAVLDKILQLKDAQILLDTKIGNKSFLEKIIDDRTKQEVKNLVKKHKLKFPEMQSVENRQARVETAQQEKQGAGIYSFFSWVQSAVWVGSTQTALPAAAQHSEKTPASSNKSEKHDEHRKNNGESSRFFDKESVSTGLRHRVKTEEKQPLLKETNNSQVSVH